MGNHSHRKNSDHLQSLQFGWQERASTCPSSVSFSGLVGFSSAHNLSRSGILLANLCSALVLPFQIAQQAEVQVNQQASKGEGRQTALFLPLKLQALSGIAVLSETVVVRWFIASAT